jgi:TP901 family phage tail tape measure protein
MANIIDDDYLLGDSGYDAVAATVAAFKKRYPNMSPELEDDLLNSINAEDVRARFTQVTMAARATVRPSSIVNTVTPVPPVAVPAKPVQTRAPRAPRAPKPAAAPTPTVAQPTPASRAPLPPKMATEITRKQSEKALIHGQLGIAFIAQDKMTSQEWLDALAQAKAAQATNPPSVQNGINSTGQPIGPNPTPASGGSGGTPPGGNVPPAPPAGPPPEDPAMRKAREEREAKTRARANQQKENGTLIQYVEQLTGLTTIADDIIAKKLKITIDAANKVKRLQGTTTNKAGQEVKIDFAQDQGPSGAMGSLAEIKKARLDYAAAHAATGSVNFGPGGTVGESQHEKNLKLRANHPNLMSAASSAAGVSDLVDEALNANLKIEEDINKQWTILKGAFTRPTGERVNVEMIHDTINDEIGTRRQIVANRNLLKESEKAEASKAKHVTDINTIGEKYPEVLKYVQRKDPDFLDSESGSKVQTRTARGRTFFDFSRPNPDIEGGKINMRVMADMNGQILPELTQKTNRLSDSIARNMKEFLQWSVAVALVYTPLTKLQQLMTLAIQNQTLLADVLVTTGRAQSDVNAIFDDSLAVANATGEAVTDVIKSYNLALRATGDVSNETERYAKANVLLKDSITLAKLANIDQAAATDILVASLRQTGKGLDQGSSLLDKWVRVSKVANVDVNTLASSFAIVAEAADNAGLSIDELNGLIATIAASGITSAKETGNVVRAIISGVNTDPAIKELQKFGIAVNDVAGKARPFKDVITDIKGLYDQGLISKEDLNKIGLTIGQGNRRGPQVVQAIVGANNINSIAGQSARANGEAERALEIKLETLDSATIKLGNSFQKLAQTMGTEGGVLNIVTNATNAMTGFINALEWVAKASGGAAAGVITMGVLGISGLGDNTKSLGYSIAQKGDLALNKRRLNDIASGAFVAGDNLKANQQSLYGDYSNSPENVGRYSKFSKGFENAAIIGSSAIAFSAGDFAKGNNTAGYIEAGATIAGGLIGTLGGPAGTMIGSSIGGIIGQIFGQRATAAIEAVWNRTWGVNGGSGAGISQTDAEKKTAYEKAKSGLDEKNLRGLYAVTGGQQIDADKVAEAAKRGKDYLDSQAALNPTAKIDDLVKQAAEANALSAPYADPLGAARYFAGMKPGTKPGGLNVDMYNTDLAAQKDSANLTSGELDVFGSPQQSSKLRGSVADEALAQAQITKAREYLKARIQPNATNKMTVRQYTDAINNVGGYSSSLANLTTAASTNNYSSMEKGIKGVADAYEYFGTILTRGASDDITNLTSLATSISDYTNKLADAKSKNQTSFTDSSGLDVTVTEGEKRLAAAQEAFGAAAQQARQNVSLNTPVRPLSYQRNVTMADADKITERTKQNNEKLYAMYSDLEEKKAAMARDNAEKWIADEKDGIQEMVGYSQEQWNNAKQELVQEGKISLKEKDTPFSQMSDFSSAQIKLALQQYGPKLKQIQDFGDANGVPFLENKSKSIIETKDKDLMKLDVNMQIFQSLLAEIANNTKKMVDGMYNLPEGASFWLPASAVDAYYNKKVTVDNKGAADTTTTTGPTKPTGFNGTANVIRPNDQRKPYTSMFDDENVAARAALKKGSGLLSGLDSTLSIAGFKDGPYSKSVPGWMDAGAGLAGVAKAGLGIPDKVPNLSTTLNLNFTGNFQVALNGAVLAREIKKILTTDILKFGNNATSVTKTTVI